MNEACPLCDEKNYRLIYDSFPGKEAMIVRCDYCGHVYTARNSAADNEKLYSEEAYELIENRGSVFDKILNWENKKLIRRINKMKPTKGSLLDFGSGKGKFANLAKGFGWKIKCVETSKPRAEYAKKTFGLEVSTNYYSTGKIFDEKFEVLILLHVLEHLQTPKVILSELIKFNLKKQALIVIEVPNFNSFQSRIAGKNWMHLDTARHISHFTVGKLEQLGHELNLETKRTSFFSFHLGVLGMVDSFLKLLGYRGNIIYELKNKRRFKLFVGLLFMLPFALVTEGIAAFTGNGGIVRKYFILK